MSHMGGCDSMPTLTNDQPLSKTLIDPCQIKIEDKEHTKRKEVHNFNLARHQNFIVRCCTQPQGMEFKVAI